MSYQILTEAYEGPIDLFYDLVVADRIDASTLQLAQMVESLLAELSQGGPVELEHLSEFVLVLAMLCRLKARRMLGSQMGLSDDEPLENPDRDLWNQLARQTFGNAVRELAHLLERRAEMLSREAGPDWSRIDTTPQMAFSIHPGDLAELAGEVMARTRAAPDLDHLALDLLTVEEATSHLWRLLDRVEKSSFGDLVRHCGDRAEEAAWFMGLMELAGQGRVRIIQEAPADDIVIQPDRAPYPLTAAASGTV